MNLLVAWKKVLLFGTFGAVGCLAGWLVGEPFLAVYDAVAQSAGAGQGPTLISKPTAPSGDPPPLPSDFQRRLAEAKPGGAGTGDVQISLIWFNTNDLDLHCVDPNGFEIFWKPDSRRSRSGGELDVDRNAGCRNPTAEPVENIYWAKGTAPMGTYKVYLDFYQRCSGAPNETEYKINVLYAGQRKEFSGTIRKEDTDGGVKKLIHSFELEPKLDLYAPGEFEIPQSKTIKIPVAVRRAYFRSPIEVKAENLPEGVLAGKLTIPEGKDEGEIELKATEDAKEIKRGIKFVAIGGSLTASADAQLEVPKPFVQFSLWMVLAIGFWTALLAAGLCLALLVGQNQYLGKTPFSSGRVPLALVILGALAAGFVSGSIGQVLYFVFLAIGVAKLGFLIGWVLLGGLLGWGVSFFIPNLDSKKAALAGLGGGFLGALAFWIMSYAADWIGRFGGAALLGFCIGLMVAVVEVAFRRAWLEVRFSEREIITVNLGPEPVKVGGDSRSCTVWARGAAEIALRYWIRDGKVHCEDVPTKRESIVAHGDTRTAGGVTIVVRTGSAPLPAGGTPTRPPRPALPAPVPVTAQPPPAPPPQPAPAPAMSKPPQPDYDDGLPMPMGPPPPLRPAATSILDIDDLRAMPRPAPPPARPPAPAPVPAPKPTAPAPAPPAPAARSMGPPVPKPPVPAAAKSMAPPVPKPPVPDAAKSMAPPPKPPIPAAAKSMAPPAPKPPAPGPPSAPNPGNSDACPTCGRKSHGKPGARYCMVCDKTF